MKNKKTLADIFKIVLPLAYKGKQERKNIECVNVNLTDKKLVLQATNSAGLAVLEINDFDNVNKLPQGKYSISLYNLKTILEVLKLDANVNVSHPIREHNYEFPNTGKIINNNYHDKSNGVFSIDRINEISKCLSKYSDVFNIEDDAVNMRLAYTDYSKRISYNILEAKTDNTKLSIYLIGLTV